jgi:hypothetical protein
LFAVALAACRGPEPRSGAPTPSPSSTEAVLLPSSGSNAATDAPPTAPSAERHLEHAASPSNSPEALALLGCTAPKAEVRLPDDAGALFDNAMSTAEAGRGDRARGILDALRGGLPAFRCCFEPWAATSPANEARALLRLTLEADGHAAACEVAQGRSTLTEPTTIACLNAAAMRLSYPASPTKRPTIVEYPLRAALPR